MEDLNLSQGNLVVDEVNVNLDVLHATMVDKITSHIDNANIVTVHDGRRSNTCMELLEKPTALGDGMHNRAVLSLSTGMEHCCLVLGEPRVQIVDEEETIDVECLESGQPTQSTSEYTVRVEVVQLHPIVVHQRTHEPTSRNPEPPVEER
jgi:hypothetical protein